MSLNESESSLEGSNSAGEKAGYRNHGGGFGPWVYILFLLPYVIYLFQPPDYTSMPLFMKPRTVVLSQSFGAGTGCLLVGAVLGFPMAKIFMGKTKRSVPFFIGIVATINALLGV